MQAIQGRTSFIHGLVVLSMLAVAGATTGCRSGECGDGEVTGAEECDDGNAAGGDGCAVGCLVEAGYTCVGSPSTCTLDGGACGDGTINTGEGCDDGNPDAGDGCDDTCAVEGGFTCTGEPSVCTLDGACGDGILNTGETCDDGGTIADDGCSDACAEEAGWNCVGEPSVCMMISLTCGDGVIDAGEMCDDGDTTAGDGCDDACFVEAGYSCAGEPSVCTTTSANCGDGTVDAGEDCDDSGESATCNADCTFAACGDGAVNATAGETCDDAGESATCDDDCTAPVCGDGNTNGAAGEQCEDGNLVDGDGCSSTCTYEATCGNGAIEPGETCDDGNTTDADGCDALCQVEPGTTCGDAVNLNTAGTTTGSVTIYDGDTTGATLQADFGMRFCGFGADLSVETVLHTYTTSTPSFLEVETLDVGGALTNTVVWAYLDCLDLSASDYCDNDIMGVSQYSQFFTGLLPAGTTIFIAVSGFAAGEVGPYQLEITETTVGIVGASGTCTAPVAIGDGTYIGETLMGDANDQSGTCQNGGAPESVFEITVTGTVDLSATVNDDPAGPAWDVGVYLTESPCAMGLELACTDATAFAPETIVVTDLGPGTYYLVVDGYDIGEYGSYVLDLFIIDVILVGDPCNPAATRQRCETGAICVGPPGSETCQVPTTLLDETFDTDLGGFTLNDAGGDGDTWGHCDPTGGCFYGNFTGSASDGGFALVFDVPGAIMDGEILIGPPLDATGLTSVFLEFDTAFDYDGNNELATVEVSPDGVVWTAVTTFMADTAFGGERVLVDISADAAGAAAFQIRFVFDDDTMGGMFLAQEWRIDDVLVYGL